MSEPERERRKEKRRWQKAKLHRDIIVTVEQQFKQLDEKLQAWSEQPSSDAAAAGEAVGSAAPAPFDLRVEGQREEVFPVARHTLSRASFGSRDKVVLETPDEASGKVPCGFLNEAGFSADCVAGSHVYALAAKYLEPSDSALELGARYGAGTCAIAGALKNSGRLVAVEPNEDVWAPLLWNRHSHHCASWVFRGVVSDRDMVHPGSGEDRGRSKLVAHGGGASSASGGNSRVTPHLSYTQLQQATGVNFTALVIDCVGCIDYLFRGNNASLCETLAGVRVVILKGDVAAGSPDCKSGCVDYDKWEKLFAALGFAMEEKKEAEFSPGLHTFAFVRFKSDQSCADDMVVAAEEAVLAEPQPPEAPPPPAPEAEAAAAEDVGAGAKAGGPGAGEVAGGEAAAVPSGTTRRGGRPAAATAAAGTPSAAGSAAAAQSAPPPTTVEVAGEIVPVAQAALAAGLGTATPAAAAVNGKGKPATAGAGNTAAAGGAAGKVPPPRRAAGAVPPST